MAEVSFGEWLKRRRSALGLTQQQLARQIHCSTSALRKFESEERHPSAEIVGRLAEIFSIHPEERKSFLRFARGDWQAISGRKPDEEPWQVSRPVVRSNLPASTTSFIGREKEIAEITDLILKHRLVTLTGAGGIGKTRLSIQTASTLSSGYPDGLWLVELAPLSDPALVPQAIVNTLGLIEQAGRSPLDILTDFLQKKRALLILDNCEHLMQACARLAEKLLQFCPDLHILATSREALDIPGEAVFFVPSLSTPDPLHLTRDSLPQFEAVQLFLERAQTTLRGFSVTQDNALAIARICHHLDGIPLALELAAARVKLLRVDEIAARLDDRFRLLTGGARTALPRHQTLQAMIDWSHDLLSEPERMLLRRLSVFAGGWTVEAAEAVCTDLSPNPSPKRKGESAAPSLPGKGAGGLGPTVLDLLTSLANKSLILAKRKQGQETRYRLLETIRQYANEKLWAAGERELMRQRHLVYFVDLAERAEPNLRAFDMALWLDRLESELDNIRAALDYALESDIEAQLRLASALLWFWHIRGHKNEGIDWLERGLSIETVERADQPLIPSRAMLRGKALNASGYLMSMNFEIQASTRFEESLALFQKLGPVGKQGMAYALLSLGLRESSLTLFREIGDKFGAAECLMQLTWAAQLEDDYKQAIVIAEEQLGLRREIGDLDGTATALAQLAGLFFAQDDYQRAIAMHNESLASLRKVGNKWAVSFGLSDLGDVLLWQGDYERATKIYEEALVSAKDVGDKFLSALSIYNLGAIAWFQGDYAHAIQMITESLGMFRDLGNLAMVATNLHALGDIALAQGDGERAFQSYQAELEIGREPQFERIFIYALDGLGKVAWAHGDYQLAAKRFKEELKMSRKTGLKPSVFHALYGLGRVAQSQGDYAAAHALYREALESQTMRTHRTYYGSWLKTYVAAVAYPIGAFAVLAAKQNQLEHAARLLGAAENLYVPLRFEMSAKERAEHDQAIAAARAALSEEAFAKAWAEGQAMTLDEAVAYALEENHD